MHGIFVEERDGALAELAARRRALEQFAHKELETRLAAQLNQTRPAIDNAARDPLVSAAKMWLVDRGQQIVPRSAKNKAGDDVPAATLRVRLLSAQFQTIMDVELATDPDGPWAERLQLLQRLKRSVKGDDRSEIETAVRELLSHRAAYVIATTKDIPYSLAALKVLQLDASPARGLMEALLRDGLSGRTTKLEGLQRQLLRHRARFSQKDMESLSQSIVALCEPHNVPYADFQERVGEPPGAELTLPEEGIAQPTLLYDGSWYVEPPRNGRVYGIAANLPAVLDEITMTMRERALLGSEDEVKGNLSAPSVAVSEYGIDIASAQWQPATDAIHGRYRLKAFLEVLIALLAFGVMGLAAWIYRRRQRFLELKSDFVSAVSHELRTPLASIRLMAETLERRTKGMVKARDYPTRIIRDVDGLSFLVENILSFNRLSHGRWTAKLESIELQSIVAKLDGERDLWARRNAELTWEGVDHTLRADPDLLQLLLTNLARNACSYNERDPAKVHLSGESSDGDFVLCITDNGIGIPPTEQEKIFDDFYRAGTKKGGERGSGLGLSICRKIMEAHGGNISVRDTGPEGTTFELTFPTIKDG